MAHESAKKIQFAIGLNLIATRGGVSGSPSDTPPVTCALGEVTKSLAQNTQGSIRFAPRDRRSRKRMIASSRESGTKQTASADDPGAH